VVSEFFDSGVAARPADLSELFDLQVEDLPEAEIVPAERALSASLDCPTWR
jgi:hypothetical protein